MVRFCHHHKKTQNFHDSVLFLKKLFGPYYKRCTFEYHRFFDRCLFVVQFFTGVLLYTAIINQTLIDRWGPGSKN